MAVRHTIQELLNKAEKWRDRGINEADTKALFIEPMLGVLGWDVHDLDTVNREYRVYDGTLIDYALKVGNKPRVFVEAKPLATLLDDRQLIAKTVNYANNEGVVWCVLTNGLQYHVYKSNEPVDMKQKLLFKANLDEARNESGAQEVGRLLSYLGRESIEFGRLDEWGEATFTDVRVKSALDGLLTNPPLRFIKLILEKLEGGPAVPREKVKDSLGRMATVLGGHAGVPSAVPPVPIRPTVATPPPHVGWSPLDQFTVSPNQSHPNQIRLPNGTIRPLNAWKYLLVEVVRYLIDAGALGPQHCPVQMRPSNKRFLVHTSAKHPNGKPFFAPVQIASLWVETHASAKNLHHHALFLIQRAGESPTSFQVL